MAKKFQNNLPKFSFRFQVKEAGADAKLIQHGLLGVTYCKDPVGLLF
jgi:hypothetical protein